MLATLLPITIALPFIPELAREERLCNRAMLPQFEELLDLGLDAVRLPPQILLLLLDFDAHDALLVNVLEML